MPDIDKPTVWELPAEFDAPPDWELPVGLRGRVMEVGPSQALAEEFGLDYMVVLIDVDFAGISRRSQGEWVATSEYLDPGELAGMGHDADSYLRDPAREWAGSDGCRAGPRRGRNSSPAPSGG